LKKSARFHTSADETRLFSQKNKVTSSNKNQTETHRK